MATIVRSFNTGRPRSTDWRVTTAVTEDTGQSALTLRLVSGTPFAQLDWPLPRRGPYPFRPFITGGRFAPEFQVAPFVPTDWPRPLGPPRSSLVDSARPNLLLLSTHPFGQTDWPIPGAAPRRASADLGPNRLGTLLVEAAPFAQLNWPTPPWPRRAATEFLPPNLVLAELATPFAQRDWPAPWGWPTRRLDEPSTNLVLLVTHPFAQLDWPQPWPVPDRLDWAPPDRLTTLLVVPVPFAQLDWPPAFPADRPLDTALWGTNPILLVPVVAGTPFAQTDWPLPPAVVAYLDATGLGTNPILFSAAPPPPLRLHHWVRRTGHGPTGRTRRR